MFRPESEWWVSRHQQIEERNERSLRLIAQEIRQFGTELNIGTLYSVCLIDFLLFRANVTSAEKYSCMSELQQWADKMNSLYPSLCDTKPVMPPQ